jgi:hypothetical protein
MKIRILLGILMTVGFSPCLLADDYDSLKVQRNDVFEFAETPTLTQKGNDFQIRFTAKDYCDATVAIENEEGRIIRHLASGVLGKNAPEPFQKNSLTQIVPGMARTTKANMSSGWTI